MFKKVLVFSTLLPFMTLLAKEHLMGPAQEIDGMEVASVWLHPMEMDIKSKVPAKNTDIHLELDIHATKHNKNTFAEGWWIPYLTVEYKIEKLEGSKKERRVQKGKLMPMIAADGPHYGKNINLKGPGNYRINYKVYPPNHDAKFMFGRHLDPETKAPEWFKPFTSTWEFSWPVKNADN